MRITICTGPTFAVPPLRGGAVQRVWCGLAPEFVRRGHSVTVFARAHPEQPQEEELDGVVYRRWGGYAQSTSIRKDLLRCLFYAVRAACRVPPADVVVTNDFWMPAVLPLLQPQAGRVAACIQRFPKGQFALYRKCAAILPVSQSVASAICEQTPSGAAKVSVVPNCVDSAFLAPSPAERGCEGPARLLFVGRLHPEKGLGLLVTALRSLNESCPGEWRASLVGPWQESEGGGGAAYLADLRRSLSGLPVQIEPPVFQPSALARVYDSSDIFVYPSVAETGEAMPLAPLEAMARGVVPVVSDLGAFSQYLENGRNGVVFNHRGHDAGERLASALQTLIKDAGLRGGLAAAGRRTAEGFSPAAIAVQYLDVFQRLVGAPA